MLQVNRRWFSRRYWRSQQFSIAAGGCITSAATTAPSPRRLFAVQDSLHGASVLVEQSNIHVFTRYVYNEENFDIFLIFFCLSFERMFALHRVYAPSMVRKYLLRCINFVPLFWRIECRIRCWANGARNSVHDVN